MIKRIFLVLPLVLLASCYTPSRSCQDFKTGTFEFESFLDGELQKTTFVRNDTLEIDYFQGSQDSSSIRWINDCEYILTNLNPKNRAQEKPIHMKILTTDKDSYTFEYGLVGESKKERGTAKRVDSKANKAPLNVK